MASKSGIRYGGHVVMKSPIGYLRFVQSNETELRAELLNYTDEDLNGPGAAKIVMNATSRPIGLKIVKVDDRGWVVLNGAGEHLSERCNSAFEATQSVLELSLPYWLAIGSTIAG